MTVRDLVAGICQEYNLTNYQVRTLPEKTLLNLEANATAVENAEIAIEDVDKMLSNFQLDNLHTSEFIKRKLHTLINAKMDESDILLFCWYTHLMAKSITVDWKWRQWARCRSKWSGIEPWQGTVVLCSLARHFTLPVPLSTQVYQWVPANCWGNLTNCGEVTCDRLASCPREVEILLAASCYRNQDKLRQLWASLRSKASLTLLCQKSGI